MRALVPAALLLAIVCTGIAEPPPVAVAKAGESGGAEAMLDQHLQLAGESAKQLQSMLPHIGIMTSPFASAFFTSYLLIIVSEIGDKTFFIAALLAMKRGALITFTGCASALLVMTVLSAFAGKALPSLVDPRWTHFASIALFVVFGVKLLWEGYNMEDNADAGPSELEEVEIELQQMNSKREETTDDLEDAREIRPKTSTLSAIKNLPLIVKVLPSAAFTEAFTLTFAAEWGDRSQIATLALGASKNIMGVNIGAVLGHCTCTFLAVLGGRVLAEKISEKTITLIGGLTFLFFSVAGYLLEM